MERDDISVPPIGLEGAFFDETGSTDGSLEIDTRDPVAARKLTPGAAKRRARFAKYVTAAVALSAALCAAALVKNTAARGHEAIPGRDPFTAAPAAAPVTLNVSETTDRTLTSPPPGGISAVTDNGAASQTTVPAPPSESQRPAIEVADPHASAPTPTQEATGASTQPSPAVTGTNRTPAAPLAAAPADPKEAAKEKAKAQAALEWGKMNTAISSGERSVELDSGDAEAWLILGAAYQQKGDSKNAVRCFRACLEQAKRGPKNECASMLR